LPGERMERRARMLGVDISDHLQAYDGRGEGTVGPLWGGKYISIIGVQIH